MADSDTLMIEIDGVLVAKIEMTVETFVSKAELNRGLAYGKIELKGSSNYILKGTNLVAMLIARGVIKNESPRD